VIDELEGSGWECFGRTELLKSMSRLALGTAQFGFPYGIANRQGQVNQLEAKAMLENALIHGIDTLDTAIAYGESESCLGQIGTMGFKLISKLPAFPESCSDVVGWVNDQVSGSLDRLGVSTLYGLMLHRPDQLLGTNGGELYKALQDLKERGVVQKVGVSIYSPSELKVLVSLFHFDLVQAPFNLVDRRLLATGWLQHLKDDGVEVHTRSAFLQGLLLMAQEDIPSKFKAWGGLWERWHTWLFENNISALQACLAFPLAYPEIDRLVVGADSVQQLQQIIDAATITFSETLPDIACEAENLINPSCWPSL
jgi:aryl-alcohol dehydrogenase-like predicted oxidoreductase